MSNWFTNRRQEFILAHIKTYGQIRRKDIMDLFGISLPQASADINAFVDNNPGLIAYDLSGKCYTITEAGDERLGTIDLAEIRAGQAKPPGATRGPNPDSRRAATKAPRRRVTSARG